jgi:AcrR family transcriptional regulator
MATDRPYHHGDLRAALLRAGEAELAATGVEGFSLRSVAKRAGVSHAAPAHHFGDVGGLLTALAVEGFRRLLAAQSAREAMAAADARSQLVAAGLGYIDFALADPALFRLIFSSRKPDFAREELHAAGAAAYGHLVAQVRAAGGEAHADKGASRDVAAVWAAAHGMADLLAAGRLDQVRAMPGAERDGFIAGVITRSLPGG